MADGPKKEVTTAPIGQQVGQNDSLNWVPPPPETPGVQRRKRRLQLTADAAASRRHRRQRSTSAVATLDTGPETLSPPSPVTNLTATVNDSPTRVEAQTLGSVQIVARVLAGPTPTEPSPPDYNSPTRFLGVGATGFAGEIPGQPDLRHHRLLPPQPPAGATGGPPETTVPIGLGPGTTGSSVGPSAATTGPTGLNVEPASASKEYVDGYVKGYVAEAVEFGPDDPLPNQSPAPVRVEAIGSAVGTSTASGVGRTRSPRRGARTTIGKAVLKNRVEIDLIAASFLVLIDERLESLRQQRSNSEEAGAARDQLEDLKRRVEAFLGATSQFAAKQATETSLVEKTNSLAAGISDWWSKRHVQICDKAFDVALFGIAAGICSLAGAHGDWVIGISGVLVGGKPVADVVKAFAKRPKPESERPDS